MYLCVQGCTGGPKTRSLTVSWPFAALHRCARYPALAAITKGVSANTTVPPPPGAIFSQVGHNR